MKELSLQEIKEIEFDILKMFHTFCTENNIRYFLAYGTLLGAIRYKKFIPWDDDVDVLVPREDYARLLTLFQDSEKYRLCAIEKDSRYPFPFAKLCDMTTRKVETIYPNTNVPLGVEIDVFPLDNYDNDLIKARQEARKILKLMSLLGLTKVAKPLTNNPLKYFVWSIYIRICKMIGSRHFVKRIIQESNQEEQKGSAYVGAKVWNIYGERGIIPAEVFADTIQVEFEGELFPAPAGYDTYLTCLYGDYLPEPPKEKQKSHHDFKAYKL